MSTSADDLTRDAFLGGRVQAWQPKTGYRAGVDAVFLAAACPARAGETVLELGCGVGVASLCLAARTGAKVTGIERQSAYADLAAQNGVDVIEADLADLPADLRQRQFHHVIMNPPYFDPGAGALAPDAGRAMARAEETPLSTWIDAATKRLRAKGTLTVIHRAARLPDLMSALGPTLGAVELLPLQPRAGREAHLILLRARKDAKTPFRLHAPVKIHAAPQHEADRPDYTPQMHGILHNGDALPFPD
ncbi:MAG: methyltransferase [Pseudomonadota bacterium]